MVVARGDDRDGLGFGSAYLFDAATGDQITKLLPNVDETDSFSSSVAISGHTVVIGAEYQNDTGDRLGSAYLFDTITGRQIARLLPDDPTAEDFFGTHVSISGKTAIVGAWGDDDSGIFSGSAYLFDASTGERIAKLRPNDGIAGDLFGWSVSISGDTAIVGAPGDNDNGFASGSAYLFDVTTGHQIAKILSENGLSSGDRFGTSVSISGDTSVVGTLSSGHDAHGFQSGWGYLFDVTTGTQMARFLPDDEGSSSFFGTSVSISGNTVIVGKPSDHENGYQAGSAYLFDATIPEPTTLAVLAVGWLALLRRHDS